MSKIKQIHSQAQQVFLFYRFFPFFRLLEHIIASPFDYYSLFGRACFPLAVNFLITSACNLKCEMCNYQSLLNTRKEEELSAHEIKDFFRRERKNKFHVFLSGGEPFLREDVFDIIECIKQLGYTCGIVTNGTLLNARKIRHLIELNLDYIIFSLLGPRNIHDTITGMQGSFNLLMSNIRFFSDIRRKTRIFITSPVSVSNIGNLLDIINVAEETGADLLRFEQMNFITKEEDKKQRMICHQQFPDEEVQFCTYVVDDTILRYLEDNRQQITRIINTKRKFKIPFYFKPYLNTEEIYSWYSNNHTLQRKCVFIWESLFINPRGDIIPCQFLMYKLGTIKNDRLKDVWNNEKYRRLRLQLKKELLPGCLRCCKL